MIVKSKNYNFEAEFNPKSSVGVNVNHFFAKYIKHYDPEKNYEVNDLNVIWQSESFRNDSLIKILNKGSFSIINDPSQRSGYNV